MPETDVQRQEIAVGDRVRGLHHKYDVERTDKKPIEHGCIVLDPLHRGTQCPECGGLGAVRA